MKFVTVFFKITSEQRHKSHAREADWCGGQRVAIIYYSTGHKEVICQGSSTGRATE